MQCPHPTHRSEMTGLPCKADAMMGIAAGQTLSHALQPMHVALVVLILMFPNLANKASTVPKGQRWQYRLGCEATQKPMARIRLAPKYQMSSRFRITEAFFGER